MSRLQARSRTPVPRPRRLPISPSLPLPPPLPGTLKDSYLDPDGFLLDKKIGVGCPKRMRDCKVMIANSPMDTDKVKIYGSKVKVDSVSKVAEIEAAEKKKMLDKVWTGSSPPLSPLSPHLSPLSRPGGQDNRPRVQRLHQPVQL